MPQIVNNVTITSADLGITQNGSYLLYTSPAFTANNNRQVKAALDVHEFLPDRRDFSGAILGFVLEREDDAGNWHPEHSILEPVRAVSFDPTDTATPNRSVIPVHMLSMGPDLEAVGVTDTTDGFNVIARETAKEGVCPSTFRFCLILHETKFGTTGAFDRLRFSMDYELTN